MKENRNRSRSGTGPWRALGLALLRLREARPDLSQHELERLAGKGASASLTSNIERGHQRPSVDYLSLVAPHLGVPVQHLLFLAKYVDQHGNWLPASAQDTEPGALPVPTGEEPIPDPLAALHAVLYSGPWPEHIAHAVYVLLADYVERHRPLPDEDAPALPSAADPSAHHIVEWESTEQSPTVRCRTDPAPQ